MMQQANIQVAVRVRPLLEDEEKQGHTCTKLQLDMESKSINVYNDRSSVYKNSQFDYVLDQTANQRKVYDKAQIADMVKASVDGYHATIFAYGQTGSGKTFTMEGYKYKPNDKGVPVPQIDSVGVDNEGIVPRAIQHLYDLIKQSSSLGSKKYTVYCSYLQIYKEKIFDLLNKSQLKRLTNDGPGLKLKWTKQDQFTVENLYTFECKSPDDVLALYHFGIKNKVVASHNMNLSSSRSHSMLSLTLEQVDTKQPDNVISSKLQLVDLAGSERQSFTGKAADKESIDINKSLFTLRQVITALTDKSKSQQYIPYRESKLTSLLRQSLGGNSFCLMIACLNPCDAYVEENISTLQYAGKASFISNKPVKNDDPKMRMIEDLKKENRLLNEELLKANETIQFLSQITGNNPQKVKQNLDKVDMPSPMKSPFKVQQQQLDMPERQGSASSAITEKRGDRLPIQELDRIIKDKDHIEKFFKEKSETLQNIANLNRPILPSAVNESKDAITERIIHTVNMMKEVLQSNLTLRETIQKQSEIIDSQNSEVFQLRNEIEDLRERLGILEEYTGKETSQGVSKLVKEKKVLEKRVQQLEQTSMNWQQFQATKTMFNKRQDSMPMPAQSTQYLQQSSTGEDYEPVRCAINNEETSSTNSDHPQPKPKNAKKQLNYQNQLARGSSTHQQQQLMLESITAGDRHQEFKIRTVNTLQKAYQQAPNHQPAGYQNQIRNRGHTMKHQNSSASKFIQSNKQPNATQYDKHRNSLGMANVTQLQKFNGSHTQELAQQDQTRNYSPFQQQNSNTSSKQNENSYYSHERQVFPKEIFTREKNIIANKPTQHKSMRHPANDETQSSFHKPPKSPHKYSANKAKRQATVNQSSQRDRLNVSADYIKQSVDYSDPYKNTYTQGTDSEKDDDNEVQTEEDAYEELRLQKIKQIQRQQQQQQAARADSGLGQLDVSLPKIKQ